MRKTISTLFAMGGLLVASKTLAQPPAAAKLAYDENNFLKAREIIDKVCVNEKHATKAKSWVYKGMIYTAIANSQDPRVKGTDDGSFAAIAYEAYEKANKIEPNDKEVEKQKKDMLYPALLNGSVERLNSANKLVKEEKAGEAEPRYLQAIKCAEYAMNIMPNDTLAPYLLMSASYSAKKYDEFKKASDVLIKHPSTKEKASYCEYIASYYYSIEKNEAKALEYAQIGLKHGGTEFLNKLVVELLNKGGNAEEAIKAVEESIKKNPKDAQNYFNLGVLYEKVKRYDEALKAYEKAIELNNMTDAIYNAGAMFFNKGVEILKVLDAMGVDEYNKKGKAENERGKNEFKKALPYFEKLYLIDAKNKNTLDILYQLYQALEMKEKSAKVKKERDALGD